ncbi:PREDICTED: uncharacterized protein LOC105117136 [Populus euphratica]|uniref:Uncharacterized protein LOC105117136 n=1 Tax=Populus euphratica TaxID=75702 RepID=A0AAJ6TLN2_POPEU|nr:PREDICTED: uncharacterized protein LOC105117136 [Populus euphratica]
MIQISTISVIACSSSSFLVVLLIAACDKSSPIETTLSSRLKCGKRAAISSAYSQVASAGVGGICGKVVCTGWLPTCLLSCGTWNTGCMAEEGGSSSLYVTLPILSITRLSMLAQIIGCVSSAPSSRTNCPPFLQ